MGPTLNDSDKCGYCFPKMSFGSFRPPIKSVMIYNIAIPPIQIKIWAKQNLTSKIFVKPPDPPPPHHPCVRYIDPEYLLAPMCVYLVAHSVLWKVLRNVKIPLPETYWHLLLFRTWELHCTRFSIFSELLKAKGEFLPCVLFQQVYLSGSISSNDSCHMWLRSPPPRSSVCSADHENVPSTQHFRVVRIGLDYNSFEWHKSILSRASNYTSGRAKKTNSKVKFSHQLLSSSRCVVVLIIQPSVSCEPSDPASCKEIFSSLGNISTEKRNSPKMYVAAMASGFGKLPGAEAASSQKTMSCKRLIGDPVSYAELMTP